MRKNPYLINILHILVVASTCLGGILMGTFWPEMVLVRVSIPLLVLLSLLPIVLETYLSKEKERNLAINILLAGVTFVALPISAGGNVELAYWKLFLAGGVTFGITDCLYQSLSERMALGTGGKLAPAMNGVLLFLASQCFQGLL